MVAPNSPMADKTQWACSGLERCIIHELQNLASMGQYDIQIKVLNKVNTISHH